MKPEATSRLAAIPLEIGRTGQSVLRRKRRGQGDVPSDVCWRDRLYLVFLFAAALAILAGCGSQGERERPSLEDAVGQMLVIGLPGERLNEETSAWLDEISPGGVILFDFDLPSGGAKPRNISSPGQLRALIADLQAKAPIPYFVAIDAEGGLVNRLKPEYGFVVDLPSHQTLGAGSPQATLAAAAGMAAQLSQLGINWNLAPVVDVNVYPESPAIGALGRSFSDDPDSVSAHAAAFAEAHAAAGVIATLKHFPGHGSAVGDTHLGVTDVTDSYVRDMELAPYRALIEDGHAGVVMTAHIVNRELDSQGRPATLSAPIVTGILRDELGFDGVVLSDDMQMGAIVEQYSIERAAVEAIKAGVDVILIANQLSDDPTDPIRVKRAILDAVTNGEISEDRIYESLDRVLALKHGYGIYDPQAFGGSRVPWKC
ncbi:MAG: glycoside hydrolase family 3 protein [Chloroflexi bacterium]|nr:glycoside hydrolase family 3 protein [Chloroflexota bacterium]MXY13627.1 glycoside hydrolase family 3 protein [Chloroflexota bacterium]